MASTNFLDGFQANFNASTSRNLPQTNTTIENPCRWSISSKDKDFAAKWRYQILGLACELSIPYHIRKPVFLWLLFQTTISYWCMTSIELTHFFSAFLVERGQISSSSHGLFVWRCGHRWTCASCSEAPWWRAGLGKGAGDGVAEILESCWKFPNPKPRHISWCFR